ncbi:MAG: VOC family protein [Pseudomonadales bacterium]|nr:VOC family protein [Pseudomonadales bacterium]MDP7596339.1 VOC family protein [Pseudomonadales bacterium]HJN49984.1 VOC family protein [Pseudomonadales bacterium]
MFSKIRAIHLAVNSVEAAAKDYADNFGIEAYQSDTLPALGIKNALLQIGDSVIELIEPLEAGQGPVAKFLEKRGEGVYMTALEVEDLAAAVEDLQARGVPLINANPEAREQGIPVFIHPKASRGLMIELVETAAE